MLFRSVREQVLEYLRTVRREQEVRLIPSLAPPDPVDLLLDLERFEVVKLGLVALELCMEFVLAALLAVVAVCVSIDEDS